MKPRYEYRSVTLCTLEGVKLAEHLKAAGWRIVSHSPFSIQFERKVSQ